MRSGFLGEYWARLGVLLLVVLIVSGAWAQEPLLPGVTDFRALKKVAKANPCPGVEYFECKLADGTTAHLATVDTKNKELSVAPHVNQIGQPTTKTASEVRAVAAVNGGYFNLSDGVSASYVFVDGKMVCDPRENRALTENAKLQPYLSAIFNRSEFRVLAAGDGRRVYEICPHDAAIKSGFRLLHSLQGGPQLLPKITDREEAFLRTDPDGRTVDSIGCNRTAARTAIGITADNHLLLLCVSGKGQSEFSSGISIKSLSELLKQLGCMQALNFDGGTSTTMAVRREDGGLANIQMVCGKTPETRVKSVLLVRQTAP